MKESIKIIVEVSIAIILVMSFVYLFSGCTSATVEKTGPDMYKASYWTLFNDKNVEGLSFAKTKDQTVSFTLNKGETSVKDQLLTELLTRFLASVPRP